MRLNNGLRNTACCLCFAYWQVLFMLCNVCKARRCKGCSFHLTLNM